MGTLPLARGQSPHAGPKMASSSTTILDRVDAADRPVGTVLRKDALRPGVGFPVVHVLIVDEDGKVALQEIAPTHERHPGWWGSSVAGYVLAGERYKGAAQRKLAEEVGLEAHPVELLGKTRMMDEGATKFIGVFLAKAPRDSLRPNPDDFRSVEFAPLCQLETELQRKVRSFTPTFEQVMRFALPRLKSQVI